jgi:micrococcal nuclease
MMSDPYLFNCTIVKIIDGDTVDVDVDLGFGCWVRGSSGRIRLFGVDCEESRTRDLEEKKYGLLAKEFVQEFLPIGSQVLLRTHEKGKYGRYLGDFKRYDKWLCAELIKHYHAVEYFGQSKHAIQQAHLENRKRIV